ncbi:MAG TPA: hypothetical protein VNA12_07470 [Mycobacteriales bacterium]|nr:hypothetical protein [Mycobacteriales bacterium]
MSAVDDPFGTAGLRRRAVDAWRASPVRLREDANAEDDAARDAYRDRLLVELAQNAADAARRAGVGGELRLLLVDGALYAANVGTPIDAAGIEALSHRRVSTKSAQDTGRFGLGFSAVLSVTDAPSVHTTAGGVQWSRHATVDALADVVEVAEQLTRRGHDVPVMRLPWPTAPDEVVRRLLDDGAATVVRLPLRDNAAVDAVVSALESVDPLMLLFLDGLETIAVDGVEPARRIRVTAEQGGTAALSVDGATTRWLRHRSTGSFTARELAGRPAEERERAEWSVVWALPIGDGGSPRPYTGDHRLRAPQPVEESVALPAVLCATVPVESGRRHVVPGPATDAVVRAAVRAYADLLAALPPDPGLVDLLPATLPAGAFDLALREHLADVLPRTRLLGSAADDEIRLRPEEAHVLDVGSAAEMLTGLLAPFDPRLVSPEYVAGGRRQAALVALGLRLLDTADVVDVLRGLPDQPPAWWGSVLAALATAPDRDSLRALPVPLDDGSVASDVRGVLLPGDPALDSALREAGLSFQRVHADAVAGSGASDLLRLLGARDANAEALLDDPRVRVAVESALDTDHGADQPDTEHEDGWPLAAAVLALVLRVPGAVAGRPWLTDLPLPDAAGFWRPAGELMLPARHGGVLVDVVDPDGPLGVVADDAIERFGPASLRDAGVLATFATLVEEDVPLVPGAMTEYVDLADDWLAECADLVSNREDATRPWVVDQVLAVRDLELVRPDVAAWTRALDELGGELIRAVTEPAVARHDAARVHLPSYAWWWLSRHECVPGADGALHRATRVAAPGADELLAALYPLAADLPEPAARLCAVLGLASRVDSLDRDQVAETLNRLGSDGAVLGPDVVRRGYRDLLRRAEAVGAPVPTSVCALTADGLAAVPQVDAVVLDVPDLAPLLGPLARVPASLDDAAALADLLDVDLASEAVAGSVASTPARTARVQGELLPPGWPDVPPTYLVHEPLRCVDATGAEVRVRWRVVDRMLHVDSDGETSGLARALAWSAGRWRERHLVEALLGADADERARLIAEAALD